MLINGFQGRSKATQIQLTLLKSAAGAFGRCVIAITFGMGGIASRLLFCLSRQSPTRNTVWHRVKADYCVVKPAGLVLELIGRFCRTLARRLGEATA
jgi:hypothetical protein